MGTRSDVFMRQKKKKRKWKRQNAALWLMIPGGWLRWRPWGLMRIINAELADAVWVLRRCCCPVSGGHWHRGLNQSDPQLQPHRALLWGTRDCSMRYNSHLLNHWPKNSLRNLILNLRSVWGDLQDEAAGPCSPVFPLKSSKSRWQLRKTCQLKHFNIHLFVCRAGRHFAD